jgi:DNA repair exonuclease SbcCD ATPase subunit
MTTTTTETPNLAEQLAAAQATAADARQRVSETQAELTRAVDTGRYDLATELQSEVAVARQQAIVADAHVAALHAGKAAAERERLAEDQAIITARQRDQAGRDLQAARDDEARRLSQVTTALEAMWEALAEAQRQLRSATSFEEAVTAARRRQIAARGQLGEWPTGHPGPTPARSNKVAVLIDEDDLVRRLAAWSR